MNQQKAVFIFFVIGSKIISYCCVKEYKKKNSRQLANRATKKEEK